MSDSTYRVQRALEAAKLWRGESASLKHIGDSENYVYSFIASEKRRFLRLTSNLTAPPLKSKQSWISFVTYIKVA